MTQLFHITHESRKDEYDDTSGDGVTLRSANARIIGSYGLQVVSAGDGADDWARKAFILNSDVLRWRFYFDPNSVSITSGYSCNIGKFMTDGTWNSQWSALSVRFEYSTGTGYQISIYVADDTATASQTTEYTVSDQPMCVEVMVERESSDGANDGAGYIWIDGVSAGSVTGIDNYNVFATINQIELGFDVFDTNVSGTIYFDDVILNDGGSEIGLSSELFYINLESDLSEFTSTVTDGGDLSQSSSAAMALTGGGMSVYLDDTTSIYGLKTLATSSASGEWRLRFYWDPNGFLVGNNQYGRLWQIYNSSSQENIYINYNWITGSDQCILIGVISDAATYHSAGGNVSVLDGPNLIEIRIVRASTDSSADGYCEWWLNGTYVTKSAEIDNYDRLANIKYLYVGAPFVSVAPSPSVAWYIDEIAMNDDGSYIGPVDNTIIDIDLETGDLSEFTSTVIDGGDLSWSASAAIAGQGGLSVLIDDTTSIYGEYTLGTVSTTGILRARFYFDPNGLTMDQDNGHYIFNTKHTTSSGNDLCEVYLIKGATSYKIGALMYSDSGSTGTSDYDITDEPHYIEVLLQRATGSTSNDGYLTLWIDGSLKETISGIDNYDQFASFGYCKIGATYGVDSATSGTYYLDELIVNDDGAEIGGLVTTDNLTASEMSLSAWSLDSSTALEAQFIRPASDVSGGNWTPSTGSTLYETVDEVTPSDVDYMRSENSPSASLVSVGLQSGSDPSESSFHIVRYRYAKSGTGTINLSFALLEGLTVRAQWSHLDISDTFVTGEYTLSAAEADSITDYSNLRIRANANEV